MNLPLISAQIGHQQYKEAARAATAVREQWEVLEREFEMLENAFKGVKKTIKDFDGWIAAGVNDLAQKPGDHETTMNEMNSRIRTVAIALEQARAHNTIVQHGLIELQGR